MCVIASAIFFFSRFCVCQFYLWMHIRTVPFDWNAIVPLNDGHYEEKENSLASQSFVYVGISHATISQQTRTTHLQREIERCECIARTTYSTCLNFHAAHSHTHTLKHTLTFKKAHAQLIFSKFNTEGCCILFSGANNFTDIGTQCRYHCRCSVCVFASHTHQLNHTSKLNRKKENSFNLAPISSDETNLAARGRNVNRAVNCLTPHFCIDV